MASSTRTAGFRFTIALFGSAVLFAATARSGEVTVAVAANFRATLEALAPEFEAESGHRLTIVSGSTGLLYAQIRNGAPYDVFLAADQERPQLLADEGFGQAASVFTYAIGRLAIWSRDPQLVDDTTLGRLASLDFLWFAIAEPEVAPYGAAARQVLEALGVWDAILPRIVTGQNVAGAFAHINTQNASLGLIALSQALDYEGESSFRIVPGELHLPVRQDALLLDSSRNAEAAASFLEFLRSPAALEIIRHDGFAVDAGP